MATQVNMGTVSEQVLAHVSGAAQGCTGRFQLPRRNSALSIHFLPLLEAIVTVLAPSVLRASILQSVLQTLRSEDLPLLWG